MSKRTIFTEIKKAVKGVFQGICLAFSWTLQITGCMASTADQDKAAQKTGAGPRD